MKTYMTALLSIGIVVGCSAAFAGTRKQTFAGVPKARQAELKQRLALYIKDNRTKDWKKLYGLVSDTGRGGVNRHTFVRLVKAAHGNRQFATSPDLLKFRTDHVTPSPEGGFDIYGCGRAQREGVIYKGIAVVHAVFEHKNWFFTGWSFTEFPNEPCKDLSEPGWKPYSPLDWSQPMEALRNRGGAPFVVEGKH